MEFVTLQPVGIVRNEVQEPVDDVWGRLRSTIELDAGRFSEDSLAGLDSFSHVEVVFLFHRVGEGEIVRGARHPRGETRWPRAGIFAQRGKNRPNRIGTTVCRLLAVRGLAIEIEGLDAIDGTPVLDIKPYIREFGPRGEVKQPEWASELMSGYWAPANE